jgi:hypothetical protein
MDPSTDRHGCHSRNRTGVIVFPTFGQPFVTRL